MTGARNNVNQPIPAILLGLAVTLVLTACGGSTTGEPEQVDRSEFKRLAAESPPALAEHYSSANELIDAGRDGFDQALSELQGFPTVVNVWASWCGPCRAEFPHFREVALEYGDRVAFVGLDSDDNDDAARTFLRDHPVPYPSYTDPDKRIAVDLGATFGLPATIFLDEEGEQLHIHHGGYTSNQDLIADIERHALGR